MAQGTRVVSDVLTLMRQIISRQSTNDPQSADSKLLSYLNDFVSLSMPCEIRLFEEFGTLDFNIDETNTTGVYTFNDLGVTQDFMEVNNEAFIAKEAPTDASAAWTTLRVYRDPAEFTSRWGYNNVDLYSSGMPSDVLIYGNELTFRTIPDTTYIVRFYGYKKSADYADTTVAIQYDFWLRYLAYGAAKNYVNDYGYSEEKIAKVTRGYNTERKRLGFQQHMQYKKTRGFPQF